MKEPNIWDYDDLEDYQKNHAKYIHWVWNRVGKVSNSLQEQTGMEENNGGNNE